MATKTKVVFDSKKWASEVLKKVSEEQTLRLIAYAKDQINNIGVDIESKATKNNLDRTGNLLDSLCWGVFYNGKVQDFGFYRDDEASGISHLHEWSRPMGQQVDGHLMAEQFIAKYTTKTKKGWEVFFAVLAPYWGYWEKGFSVGNKTYHFSVMSHFFDAIKKDLEPSDVKLSVYVPS